MHGYVAVTDPGWAECLSQRTDPGDANFWRPSTRRVNLAPGTPFFFKLKAPDNAIAGYGFFDVFTVLPDWLAWETFREANGTPSLAALRARLHKIREGARIEADPGGQIGCCLIAEARMFARDAWVAPPRDWSPRTQTGAKLSLAEGEGLRIWQECFARSADARVIRTTATIAAAPPEPRFGAPGLYRHRLGQGIFRVQVLNAYGRACAVTQEHSLPVLEAAHIRPYASGGEHTLANGLSLRTDLHRLFDRGYATVDADHRLVVSDRLREHFDNGRTYYAMRGRPLTLPADPRARPSPEALAWHRETVFLG